MARARAPIVVLAGTNGSGKSSVAGAFVREHGGDYWNPDEAAAAVRAHDPMLTQAQANTLAWREGVRQLRDAIERRHAYVFETTLGGRTITDLLLRAAARIELRVFFVGLASVELHIARVAARVARGGHPIPEADIRRRYDDSRKNLVRLLPALTELRLWDNSAHADPERSQPPRPKLVLHLVRGRVREEPALRATPEWAKPIVAAALTAHGGGRR